MMTQIYGTIYGMTVQDVCDLFSTPFMNELSADEPPIADKYAFDGDSESREYTEVRS